MQRTMISALLALACGAALATGKPPATPPLQGASATSSASAEAGAWASGSGGAGGSASMHDASRSNFYVLPSPAQAAPLPGTICPKGDSHSVSLVWGFVSWSQSTTRTELECLERWAAVLKANQPVVMQQPMLIPREVIVKARPAGKRKAACAQGQALVCRPK